MSNSSRLALLGASPEVPNEGLQCFLKNLRVVTYGRESKRRKSASAFTETRRYTFSSMRSENGTAKSANHLLGRPLISPYILSNENHSKGKNNELGIPICVNKEEMLTRWDSLVVDEAVLSVS